MLALIIGLLLFVFLSADAPGNQVLVDGYKTRYFTPQSKAAYDQIKTHKFALMEDAFMECEYLTVYQGISHLKKAIQIHQEMTETYPNIDLRYHNLALNQMGRPSKQLDPNLVYL